MTGHRVTRALRAAALVAVGLAAVAAPGAAQAQFFGGWGGWDNGGTWDGLAPQQVRRAISERGFRVLAPLRRNGNVFIADVVDARGRRERLIVAAADAQILQRFLVDDGRRPFQRGDDEGRGLALRGGDDNLVPPADIPDAGRRLGRPLDREPPAQRFGDIDPGAGESDPAPDAAPRRAAPPVRTVKPRPRVVERTPEPPTAGREPGPVDATPLAPAAPRAPAPAPVAKAPTPPPAVVASRPEAAPTAPAAPAPAPAAPAPAASASRRMTDPLAIPGGSDASGKPVRSVASGITGTPAPATPPRPGDVPVAPLD